MNTVLRRKVMVTGSSRGLGAAIAHAFARNGDFVYLGYRVREDLAQKNLEAIRSEGGDGEVVRLDISDSNSIAAAFSRFDDMNESLDVLINNAGIMRDAYFASMPESDWLETMNTNLNGTYRCCRAGLKGMVKRRNGVVINVASVAGLHASPGQTNYSAAKGGIIAFTKSLAVEMAPLGIRINAIAPGLISSGMALKMNHQLAAERKKQIPLGRFGTPEEVADVAVFLASKSAGYIIGQTLTLDGGLTL